ncbi:amino acid/amide ABC transporter ATP-binding protein 2, HAAT family (TC 3.A.1.4.-) [Desulfacinum infernum DSM 9756]|uniref:Amino acid/amide ABC transporter ATP-binding protein 2, HAAT family (TC 3.A.1.4.-) n=1 Tax=Desulfacinum infernum DSM 9756 TaxID=1121391 RepID=A0A1M4UBS3_9BACT|nr:ABC transporter ATP-binding protein [Desulfacinum infernum]SHE54013.1 amino acid/amide ABC transporter ATP-binding protein 2, HAAT family (TC 3.A.1.4.-) [Desulfacinum infernum DSM 9756]
MLEVRDIHSYYGKSHILHGVSMTLQEGEMVCLLGRNGVGKSTTLKSIMGMVRPRSGSIRFQGRELIGLQPYQVARLGVGIVPEERRIFGSLTVEENLLIGKKNALDGGDGAQAWTLERVYQVFPRLHERRTNKGRHLSGGEQQMLTVARTLMGNPRLILVDEPTEGLAPLIVQDVLHMLAQVRRSGVTVLMVEQNFKAAVQVADRFYVMGKGQIVFEGDVDALLAADEVRKTYLEV